MPSQNSRSTAIATAELADRLGFDSVWVAETWAFDAVSLGTQLAERVTNADVSWGIANIYSRSPGVLAMTAASFDEIADTDVRVALGTSGPAVIENFHGVAFDRPLQRTREYLEILDLLLSGEQADYDGELFDLSGFSLDPEIDREVPLYNAAMGDGNLRLTGQFADGWLPLFVPVEGLADAVEQLAVGAERADREPDDIDVVPYVLTCISEADPERARRLVSETLAFYVCAMGDFYYNTITGFGYGDEADAMRDAWYDDDKDGAAQAVTDEMLDSFTISGTPETARRTFDRFIEAGVDEPVAYVPPRASESLHRTTLTEFSRL
jgi:alkanesulfonate monooxygenase SsuD/methylene tetrahydromethanopterin reductase-like flavin-dependent oxidoreductase (luciferase family)